MVSFELGKEKGKDDFFRLVTSVVVNFFTVIDLYIFFGSLASEYLCGFRYHLMAKNFNLKDSIHSEV